MDEKHILVVEDDQDINRLLERILKQAGYQVSCAYSGTEAKLLLSLKQPDLILLDLMLPGISGEELIKIIREEQKLSLPILVLSAKVSLESKVESLTIGADDYITKPFEPQEVLVRVLAALRRSGSVCQPQDRKVCTYKNLCLDESSRRVTVKGEEISLTRHEYDILQILLMEPQKVFSRETIYDRVWQNGYYGEDNTVNVHVSNLRRKIGALDPGQEYIKTVWGIGFKMA